jgi:hypothetical protein
MRDIHEALGELLAVRREMVAFLVDEPGQLADLERRRLHAEVAVLLRGVRVMYPVTAPCRLAQLADAVGSSTGSGSGSNSSGSPALVSAEALDLWTEIVTATAAWAVAVGVDRSRYLRPAVRAAAVPGVRRELPGAYDPQARHRGPARTVLVMTPDDPRLWSDTGTPPAGRLLRVTAAEADRLGYGAMVSTIARDAVKWAGRIDGLFRQQTIELVPVRGVACPDCGTASIVEERDGEHYRSPALVLVLGESPYRWCRACDAAEWVNESIEAA